MDIQTTKQLGLNRDEAARLRDLHARLSLLPLAWFVVICVAAVVLPAPETAAGILAVAVLALGSIVAILVSLLVVERKIYKAAAVEGAAKWRVLGISFFWPFGKFRAVDELLAEAVRRYEGNAP